MKQLSHPTTDAIIRDDGLMRATPAPFKRGFGYKKAGVVISKLIPESGVVRSLFADTAAIERESKLSSAMDAINHTFGRGAVKMVNSVLQPN